MLLASISAHFALALVLFFLINWVGRHSIGMGYLQLSLFLTRDEAPAFNFLLRVLSPAVFIVCVSMAAYSLKQDWLIHSIWYVAPISYAYRVAYNLGMGRRRLINWTQQTLHILSGSALAYLAYSKLIVPRHPLFPDLTTLGNELWIGIFVFLYAVFNNVRGSPAGSERRKNRYVQQKFLDIRSRFGHLIEGRVEPPVLELAAYAIFIHEDFNRPPLWRGLERLLHPLGVRTTGLGQVTATRALSDAESVVYTVKLLQENAKLAPEKFGVHPSHRGFHLLHAALAGHNKDSKYMSDVLELMSIIALRIEPKYEPPYRSAFN